MGIEDDIRDLQRKVEKLIERHGCPDAKQHCKHYYCEYCERRPKECGEECSCRGA